MLITYKGVDGEIYDIRANRITFVEDDFLGIVASCFCAFTLSQFEIPVNCIISITSE